MSVPDAKVKTSPFWQFSLKFYAMPGVGPACIALQDEAGVDVNVLLFLLWNASLGRALDANDVKELDATVGLWRDTTVIPLRGVRRALKSGPSIAAPEVTEAYRSRIKQVELEAERLQQEAMYAMAQSGRYEGGLAPLEAAKISVASYQELLQPLPHHPIETLLSVFAKMTGNG
jgi:uncharacterized protein (TIGR02444 family)